MLNERVGNNIRVHRTEAGLTQEELAYRAKMNAPHLGTLERGCGNPKLSTICSIARALGLNPAMLFNEGCMGEEAYPTLNYFVKECLPDIGSMRAYDPFLLMEYLGIIILDRLTLSDVELAAHNYIQTLRYERTRSLRDGTVCHYGIQLINREHRKLILEDRIVDICTDGKQVSELADLMTKKHLHPCHFREVVEDFCQNNYTLPKMLWAI